ncbi:phage tail protein [Pseudomonas mandelii]|uniref:phage tail protein n=1 Tax=Pseudomonas mandelii TaxID=75612 RepID=UPI001C83F38B|nr:phage tail protein [Pseudomonas mandelii]QZA96214.1 phage tail protein [Pseudomonas mandelii]
MIDANSQFFAILTNVGLAKQANADALGIPWKITEMGVGDANLTDPIPTATQTRLINEWRRRPLNQLKVDTVDPAIIIAEQIIPADEGGRWIREIGLYDEAGDLVAVANCAPSYKPLLSQGSGRTQVVRMNFIVNNSGNITLKIDPAVVLASRSYVDAAILEVLPANKTAGEFTRVKVNNRGVVVSGDNPDTLAGMGITDTYTKPQIESMIAQASALPVGTMVAFPLNKLPPGFLEIDGSVKSIAAYPDLAAFLGTAFNTGGEGAGNFRLPESRGEFLRGWDHGRGIDVGRAIGSYQADDFKSHLHMQTYFVNNGAGANRNLGDQSGNITGGPTLSNNVTTSTGGTETRPRNLAVMWCIKAWNAPINQGNIDVAALVTLAAQATENNQGTAKIATQAQVNAGTDDATIVTPKKLRFGFSVSWGASGNIVFPSWFGGIVIQWISTNTGQIAANFAETVTAPWPMEFPNACWFALGGTGQSPSGNGYASVRIDGVTAANVTSSTFAHITGWVMRKIYAIGR